MPAPTRSSISSSPAAPSRSGDPVAADRRGDPELLDLSGEVCPYTFVRTRLALEALPLGASLAIVVDHEPARRNLPRSAIEWGQEITAVEEVAPGRWLIVVVKRVT